MSNFLKRLNNSIEVKGYQPAGGLTTRQVAQPLDLNNLKFVGNDVTFYPADGGQRFINYGYNLNDGVYSIVSKNAEKAGQIRFYHSQVKKEEKSLLREYKSILKHFIGNRDQAMELMRIRKYLKKAMTEDLEVKSPLSKLLNKPNRYQAQAEWIENLFGHRELTGEGNLWFNKGGGEQTLEMFCIPKWQLNLVGNGQDPFEVQGYEFNIMGATYKWDADAVLMWKYANKAEVSTSLEHMRGMAPLQSFIIGIQGMNEADRRVTASNKNAGAYGFAYWKNARELDAGQKREMRDKFDAIMYSEDMAGKVAVLSGEWGYHNIGMSMAEQEILKQYDMGFIRLCRIFKTPHGIFNDDAKYANGPQYKRDWVYDKIAPNIYQLRDKLSERLIPEFGLDPETNLIDCDIMSLPEMSRDLKEMAEGMKGVVGLTIDQQLQYFGYEPIGGPMGEARLIPSGYQTLDELTQPMGEPLDQDINDLNL
jgi:HK97 family phage portal protein